MIRTLQRSLSVLVCILLVHFVSFAQETTDPKTTKEDPKLKEQPLDKPTEVKEVRVKRSCKNSVDAFFTLCAGLAENQGTSRVCFPRYFISSYSV